MNMSSLMVRRMARWHAGCKAAITLQAEIFLGVESGNKEAPQFDSELVCRRVCENGWRGFA